ncbi:MAG: SulP family inorganic anion transporter [Cryomorphaceae bacterium]|nr:SulP family inorganic anion transporter [Cryomorphaceae bacterium]
MFTFFKFWKQDLPAGLVVFLVALPLCLGVGLASTNIGGQEGLPNVMSGIIAGVIGGVVVAIFSGSRLGVSGPAAGLITIVLAALNDLGSFEAFLLAVVLAGVIQFILAFVGFGLLANYVPTAVIKGMLAAIGITLILKEIPHLLGYDKDYFGDESFWQFDGHNTFSELFYALNAFEPGAVILGMSALLIMLLFDAKWLKSKSWAPYIPGALVVVVAGILVNQVFLGTLQVSGKHMVEVPNLSSWPQIKSIFHFPDWQQLGNSKVWVIAMTLAMVGSLETLLSLEATDKLDPLKHKTNPHRELKAQGLGNLLSGLIGGLPVTQVIVRSSANIAAGGQSKLAAIIHGLLLFISVLFMSSLLNMIPLAVLAAVLVLVGYKLAKWSLFVEMYQKGLSQFIPFVVTIIAVLLTDLLKGIGIGILVAIFYILKRNFQNHFTKEESAETLKMILSEEVTFLNKGGILKVLQENKHKSITIDASRTKSIDLDVLESLKEFKFNAEQEGRQPITFINL